jgi:hypothetical protein
LMLLATLASGGAGPGRLATIGVNPWLLGIVSFIEIAIVSTLAAFFSARPQESELPKARKVS